MKKYIKYCFLLFFCALFIGSLLYVSSFYDKIIRCIPVRESLCEEGFSQWAKKVIDDSSCFPVEKNGAISYGFENGYGEARNFGGKRKHEGIDIIPSKNRSGCLNIISVSDGTIEKIGWLKLGGYRIGIRSKKGIYYYYAHLKRYAKGLYQGKRVYAGEILGKMGDTGYGKEGTHGKFVVHLHFGIYLRDCQGKERAINPYYLLQYLQ